MSLIAHEYQNIHVVDSKKLKHEKAIEGDKGGDKLIPDKRSSSRQTEGVSQTSVICGHQDFLSWIILTQLIFDMTYNLQQELFGCEAQEVSSHICQKFEFDLSTNIDKCRDNPSTA